MTNSKVENMIDSLIEMTADPDMPIECVEALDVAIQTLVDKTNVNKSYYQDELDPEEKADLTYMEILFKNLLTNSIAMA